MSSDGTLTLTLTLTLNLYWAIHSGENNPVRIVCVARVAQRVKPNHLASIFQGEVEEGMTGVYLALSSLLVQAGGGRGRPRIETRRRQSGTRFETQIEGPKVFDAGGKGPQPLGKWRT